MAPRRQSKRVRPNELLEVPQGVSTRRKQSSKPVQVEEVPQAEEEHIAEDVNRPTSPMVDWYYPDGDHLEEERTAKPAHGERTAEPLRPLRE